MKIIDLLNKIANGEPIPKYIKYMNYITNESDTMMVCKENIIYALDQLKTHLNDEVEIIEDNDIKKYDTGLCNGRWTRDSIKDAMKENNMSLEDIVIEMGKEQTLIKEKLFEIIDKVNDLEKKYEKQDK